MKAWHKSKKLWTAVLTALVAILSQYFERPDLALHLAGIGAILIASFAVADVGKEAKAIEKSAAPPRRSHAPPDAEPCPTCGQVTPSAAT
jgi:hypothetical protein